MKNFIMDRFYISAMRLLPYQISSTWPYPFATFRHFMAV